MVKYRPIARRITNVIRADNCFEIAGEAITRNLTIPIKGILKQKALIRPWISETGALALVRLPLASPGYPHRDRS
jgi:hypothetical protein